MEGFSFFGRPLSFKEWRRLHFNPTVHWVSMWVHSILSNVFLSRTNERSYEWASKQAAVFVLLCKVRTGFTGTWAIALPSIILYLFNTNFEVLISKILPVLLKHVTPFHKMLCIVKHFYFWEAFLRFSCLVLSLNQQKNTTKTWFLNESEPDCNYLFNSQPVFICY